jgi:hypothetical protein
MATLNMVNPMENRGFEGDDDSSIKAGDNNKMEEERVTVSPLHSFESDNSATTEELEKPKYERKVTLEQQYMSREQKRSECVKKCRGVAEELLKTDTEAIHNMDTLLEDKEFSNALFSLFDQDLNTVLDQEDWFEMLRLNTR